MRARIAEDLPLTCPSRTCRIVRTSSACVLPGTSKRTPATSPSTVSVSSAPLSSSANPVNDSQFEVISKKLDSISSALGALVRLRVMDMTEGIVGKLANKPISNKPFAALRDAFRGNARADTVRYISGSPATSLARVDYLEHLQFSSATYGGRPPFQILVKV